MVAVPLGAGVDLRRWGGGAGTLPAAVAPALVQMPQLAGTGRIGEPVTLLPGVWSGSPAPVLERQWLRDGLAIPGATGASYLPVAADDEASLACRVTATNSGGSAVAETAGLAVTYTAPLAQGALADLVFFQGSTPQTVAAASVFAGEDLTFAVSGAGATIDPATGVASIPVATALITETVSVSASNSGGSAGLDFKMTVIGAPVAAGGSPAWIEAADDGLRTFDAAARFTIAGDPAGATAAFALLAGGFAVEAGVFAGGVFVALKDGYVSIDPAKGVVSVDTGASGVLDGVPITVRASNGAGYGDLTITLRVGQPVAAITWNPNDKSTIVALSNGNRTATYTAAVWAGVRATKFVTDASNAKYYAEFLLDPGNQHFVVGIATSAHPLTGATGAASTSAILRYTMSAVPATFGIQVNGDVASITHTPADGDVIGMCVDHAANRIYFAINNTWLEGANPAAGTGGRALSALNYALYTMCRSAYVTLRSTTAEFSYTPPAGFTPYAQV